MKRKIDKEAIRRQASNSTKASAAIEGRVIPEDYVRSDEVQQFLDEVFARRGYGNEEG